MAKKTYETPVADLLVFDYKNMVVASPTGRNQNMCMGQQPSKCDGYRMKPGPCYQDQGILEASECLSL